eukprot:Nitzschia sp. Nitz4//scaffold88_size82704//6405//7754//NITZ4_005280-RA/size82704-augustus-gene-0.76-mRNA-1//1//CDS//3329559458//2243//frame0
MTSPRLHRHIRVVEILLYCILLLPCVFAGEKNNFKPLINTTSQANLFDLAPEIGVVAPSHFPKPTRKCNESNVVPIVEPDWGKHRPDADVVMAYAEGYELCYYMCFVETLRKTGFTGDIVFALAGHSIIKPHVLDYLKEQENVVLYIKELECYLRDGVTPSKRVSIHGNLDVFQMCHLHDVYGIKDEQGNVVRAVPDPRIGRVVATLRYEWYWIWCQQYNPNSWIMLIDARDTYFQRNPFEGLPRNQNGLLYFFGENAEATRIGISRKNANWIRRGYGEAALEAIRDKPTICSGSTMGEQQAIETYLRALVNEWDEADTHMTGADQGFHNYLYYSGKLLNSASIDKLVVWEQGKGIINNVGALRTKKFSEWGFYDEEDAVVYNWDGTISPVVHQYDRDNHLHNVVVRHWHVDWEREFLSKHKE